MFVSHPRRCLKPGILYMYICLYDTLLIKCQKVVETGSNSRYVYLLVIL